MFARVTFYHQLSLMQTRIIWHITINQTNKKKIVHLRFPLKCPHI